MTTFVDANIILNYLVRATSPASQANAAACRALLERVRSGDAEITTSEAVLAEVVYVLSSPRQFALTPADISSRLKPIISLPGLKLPQKRRYLRTLDIYATHSQLDFEDALSVAYVERQQPPELYSYDRDFDRVNGIQRREP